MVKPRSSVTRKGKGLSPRILQLFVLTVLFDCFLPSFFSMVMGPCPLCDLPVSSALSKDGREGFAVPILGGEERTLLDIKRRLGIDSHRGINRGMEVFHGDGVLHGN